MRFPTLAGYDRRRDSWRGPAVLTSFAVLVPLIVLIAWLIMVGAIPTPNSEETQGSGIVIATEITELWIPQELLDLAKAETSAPVGRRPEALAAELSRVSPTAAWYAFTYRGRQVNGDIREITQIRRAHEINRNAEEFAELVMAVTASPNEYLSGTFSDATVNIIPREMLQKNPMDSVRLFKSHHAERREVAAPRETSR